MPPPPSPKEMAIIAVLVNLQFFVLVGGIYSLSALFYEDVKHLQWKTLSTMSRHIPHVYRYDLLKV